MFIERWLIMNQGILKNTDDLLMSFKIVVYSTIN